MCGTCGCGHPEAGPPHAHAGGEARPHGHEGARGDARAHAHAHAHVHPHPAREGGGALGPAAGDAGAETPEPGEARRVAVERDLLAANDARAAALAARLAARGVEALGLLGAPGCGKTALLEATLRRLASEAPGADAVVEGDCATDRDARRIGALGVPAVQVETGGLCHLDARLVERALEGLALEGVRRLWIENVGNLVCPAPFACGESRRALLVSAPEGDDKPEKYPAAVAAVDLLVVAKSDLLPHLDFDPERCIASARRVRPELPALVLSARSGEGLEGWLDWVRGEAR